MTTYRSLTATDKEAMRAAQQDLSEVEKKLEKVEERLAHGEIDKGVFERTRGKLKEEKKKIEAQLEGSKNKLSNPSEFIQKAVKICTNLSNLWVSADYDSKLKLQEILFPGRILYDKKIDEYRTLNVNVILELTHLFSSDSQKEKSGQSKNFFDYPLQYTGGPEYRTIFWRI